MGRIRTTLVKRVAKQLLDSKKYEFSTNFEKNKQILKQMQGFATKRLRNRVAGYITRLKKSQQKCSKTLISSLTLLMQQILKETFI